MMEKAAQILALGFNLPAGSACSLVETDLVTLRLGISSTHPDGRPPNPWSAENLSAQLKAVSSNFQSNNTWLIKIVFHYDDNIIKIIEAIETPDVVFSNPVLANIIYDKCKVKKIVGDGNCQFRTLSYFLYSTENYHTRVRSEVCNFIKLEKIFFDQFFYQTNESTNINSADECDISGKWGNHITLLAAALLYDLRILLRLVGRGSQYSFILLNKPGENLVLINFQQEFHYEFLVPR
jgi:hypothetical protein